MTESNDDDWKRCVFVAIYERANDTTFFRAEKDIDVRDNHWPTVYQRPVIAEIPTEIGRGRPRVEVRVLDERAVDLDAADLLGDFRDAAEKCDRAVEERFQASIAASVSRW